MASTANDVEMAAYQLSIAVWIPMQLTAAIGFNLIQLTTLFGGLSRGRVWYGTMTSWAIWCLSNCLLSISGEQPVPGRLVPDHDVCLAHAVLTFSNNTLSLMMTVSLFLELYWNVSSAVSENKMAYLRRARSPLLLIVPYGVWFLLLMSYLIFAITNPSVVKFGGLRLQYCIIDHPGPQIADCIISSILLVSAMVLLAMTAIRLFKIHNQSEPFKLQYLLREYTLTFIQFSLIWLGTLISVAITIMFLVGNLSPVIYHVVARGGGPLVILIVYGLKKDIWLVWRALVLGKDKNI